MLPSFVIGLREGLEAALIVGIIAAFLRKQGRRDLLRAVMIGVGIAVVLCLAAGFALDYYSQSLPQKQQEGLETVIAVLAIGMVTYMVVWMRRNSRHLKGSLEGMASAAMTSGGSNAGRAMVVMAFLAVIREGLETVVFLLAAFNETSNGATAGLGALLGIVIAIALGYGIYRGGVRLNLSKFFRATGAVLVLVAAGLVVNALHTAHEAGWLDLGQARTIDLTWLVQPGSVQASLLTGMLGLQPRPVLIEVVAWLLYLIPVGLYVVWPPGKPAPVRAAVRGGVGVAAAAVIAAVALVVLAPSAPASNPVTRSGDITAQLVSRGGDTAVVRTQQQDPYGKQVGPLTTLRMNRTGAARDGSERYTTQQSSGVSDRPATLPVAEIAQLNGSRLPVGLQATNGRVDVSYDERTTATVRLDTRTGRVLDVAWRSTIAVVAHGGTVTQQLRDPVVDTSTSLPASAVDRATAAASADHRTAEHRAVLRAIAGWCVGLAVVAAIVAFGFWLLGRRGRQQQARTEPVAGVPDLVKH